MSDGGHSVRGHCGRGGQASRTQAGRADGRPCGGVFGVVLDLSPFGFRGVIRRRARDRDVELGESLDHNFLEADRGDDSGDGGEYVDGINVQP